MIKPNDLYTKILDSNIEVNSNYYEEGARWNIYSAGVVKEGYIHFEGVASKDYNFNKKWEDFRKELLLEIYNESSVIIGNRKNSSVDPFFEIMSEINSHTRDKLQ